MIVKYGGKEGATMLKSQVSSVGLKGQSGEIFLLSSFFYQTATTGT